MGLGAGHGTEVMGLDMGKGHEDGGGNGENAWGWGDMGNGGWTLDRGHIRMGAGPGIEGIGAGHGVKGMGMGAKHGDGG